MSDDRREKILLRLLAILTEVGGIDASIKVYRNRSEFEDKDLPALVLLDGNEGNKDIGSVDKRGVQIMIMTPQIFWVPLPPENALNVGLGPAVSLKRNALLKAIKRDDNLAMLAGSNGYVEYRGMETDLNTGAEIEGQFRLDIAVSYTLDFNKL